MSVLLALSSVLLLAAQAAPVRIAVPADRLPSELTAANELVAYLEKATGAKAEIVSEEKASGASIHLGATRFAKEAVPDLASFGDEEWTVRSAKGKLVIAGGRPRGVLYGVYHYLEDVYGVRWLTQVAEVVPSGQPLKLDGLSLRGKPAMPYRAIYSMAGTGVSRFLARNRMNVQGAEWGGGKVFGGSSECHTMYPNLGGPDEIRRLYKEHPDWFPLIDGKRYCHVERANSGAQSQLCLTNPELRAYWVAKLRAFIERDYAAAAKAGVPPPMYYAIDQNDCFDGFCQCDGCRALAVREGSNAGILLDFANHVAEQLETAAPKSRFQMMALHSTEKPPKFMKARKNVTIRLCDSTSNEVVPWNDPQNAKHFANVRDWCDHAGAISMWDYQITYGVSSVVALPTPNERTFGTDIRLMRDHNGDGFFFEHENVIHADMRDLKVWLEFKLVENPDLDANRLIDEFARLYYGPAAPSVLAYRAELAAAADAGKAHVSWFPSVTSYAFITAPVVQKMFELRREALAAVAGDAELKARVEHAFLSLERYVIVRYAALKRQFEAAGKSMKPVAAFSAHYARVFDRETEVRGCKADAVSRKSAVEELQKFAELSCELPVPEQFRKVPSDALFLIPAAFSRTWYNGMAFVDDPESPAKRVLTANMDKVLAHPHKYYPLSAYDWPLQCQILGTKDDDRRFRLKGFPSEQPKGYHWYKLAENVRLTQKSTLSIWNGFRLGLDGVVSDNSEIGQLYDIYASVKIEGGDVYKTGKAAAGLVYFFDQAAAVRKTKNASK